MPYSKAVARLTPLADDEVLKEAGLPENRLLAVFTAKPNGVVVFVSDKLNYEGLAILAEVMEATLVGIKLDLQKGRQ